MEDNSAEIDSNSPDFWVMVAALKVCNLLSYFCDKYFLSNDASFEYTMS